MMLKVTLQTSLDGAADENVRLTAMKGATGCNDNWQDCSMALDVAETGWREVVFEAKAAPDGNVYLGAAYMPDAGKAFTVYIKDIEIIPRHASRSRRTAGAP